MKSKRYTTIFHDVIFDFDIDFLDYILLDRIQYFQSKENNEFWCIESRKSQAKFLKVTPRTVSRRISVLFEKGLLVLGEGSNLRVSKLWFESHEKTSNLPHDNNVTPMTSVSPPPRQRCHPPHDKDVMTPMTSVSWQVSNKEYSNKEYSNKEEVNARARGTDLLYKKNNQLKEGEKKKEKSSAKKEKLIYPFDTDSFAKLWKDWKQYKKEQHRFTYKSYKSEQAALQKISAIAPTENDARIIIADSIANGWKGFFESSLENKQKTNAKSDRAKRMKIYEKMGI